MEHSTVETDEASREMWGVCSGKHGVMSHHEKDGFRMGEMCMVGGAMVCCMPQGLVPTWGLAWT